MSGDMRQLEDWIAPLLARLAPAQRRGLAREVGMGLRRAQSQRIAQQHDPDGVPYEPRKKQPARGKRGRIKRQAAMFRKIRQARHLRVRADTHAATVEFTGRVGRIARVHQYGLRDSVSRKGPQARYPQRRLLGFAAIDRELVKRLLLEHLKR